MCIYVYVYVYVYVRAYEHVCVCMYMFILFSMYLHKVRRWGPDSERVSWHIVTRQSESPAFSACQDSHDSVCQTWS